ncbi:MAG: phosphate/phosphite/phosphonate ABC transporter substrate-binding protein [Myxococcota bacterium]
MRRKSAILRAFAVLSILACDGSAQSEPSAGAPAQVLPATGETIAIPKTVVVGYTPHLEAMDAEYRRFAEYLGGQLGIPTSLRVSESYEDLIHGFKREEIHLAFLSPLSYVDAERVAPHVRLLATEIANGADTYTGYIVTRLGSEVTDIAALRGKRFGFVSPRSTSGFLFPSDFLRKQGIEPTQDFKSVVFLGNHSRVVDALLAGEIDAGAISSTAYTTSSPSELEVLAKTAVIPGGAVAADGRLPAQLLEKLLLAVLSVSTQTEAGKRVLGSRARINGYIAADASAYDVIRSMRATVRAPAKR